MSKPCNYVRLAQKSSSRSVIVKRKKKQVWNCNIFLGSRTPVKQTVSYFMWIWSLLSSNNEKLFNCPKIQLFYYYSWQKFLLHVYYRAHEVTDLLSFVIFGSYTVNIWLDKHDIWLENTTKTDSIKEQWAWDVSNKGWGQRLWKIKPYNF